ncbi:hypothetical protein Mal4_48700 [Maioricimonas rarisocia]|uniref:Antitoxin n=1 Tax=Maioricimonas rarisocia TaxID=2528026 RepID=A0A517ZDH1_9PLAN|nr:DUF433 domain-containing protein [Maioricimonas rarisocia]QDU40512.1 hypothetical protein Mal4_48700 [Maioricimonas rarisocia]
MSWHDRNIVDERILSGKPVITGKRIAVEFVIELHAEGWTHDQILQNYPQLTEEDIRAALGYAAARLKSEEAYPLPAP